MARVVSNSIDEGKDLCFRYHIAGLGFYFALTIISFLLRKYDWHLEEKAKAKLQDERHRVQ